MTENKKQREEVLEIMSDGLFRTLFDLDAALRRRGKVYLTTSISARLRDLRHPEFGGYTVERRQRSWGNDRVFEYRVLPPKPKAGGSQLPMFSEATK